VPPVRVVFDRKLRLPLDSTLVRSAREVPVWVVAGPDASAEARRALVREGVEVVEAEGTAGALQARRDRGLASLFCEGGARVAAALLREDAVDRLTLFYAPILLGADGMGGFEEVPGRPLGSVERWRLLDSSVHGHDTLISLARAG